MRKLWKGENKQATVTRGGQKRKSMMRFNETTQSEDRTNISGKIKRIGTIGI